MPVIYVPKELYDELVKLGEDPGRFVVMAAQERLLQIKQEAGRVPPKHKVSTKGE